MIRIYARATKELMVGMKILCHFSLSVLEPYVEVFNTALNRNDIVFSAMAVRVAK